MIKMVKYVFYIALLVQVSTSVNAESQWITKKINKATEIEKIEKMYADGSITKAKCIIAKSKILKLPSVSKTICDNIDEVIKKAATEAAIEAVEKAEEDKTKSQSYITKKKSKKKYYEKLEVSQESKKQSEEVAAVSAFDPPKGDRDLIPPTITVASKIESKEPRYFIEGTVIDYGGSKKGPYLYVDGERIELDKEGKFSVSKYSPTDDQITIVAYDGNGNVTKKIVNVIIISSTKGKYYALVIGNNDYQHLEKLDAAENDARAIHKVLERKYEFEVTPLYNATRKDTVNGIHNISRKLNNEDSLLIYYAGHGIFDKDEDEGYWLPVDAAKSTSAEGIGNTWITKQVKATKAKHVLLLIDSCFAGSITKTRSALNLVPREELDLRFIKIKSSKKSRVVITSGGNEPVVDSDGGDHSWFAKKLLEILNENNNVIYSLNIYDELQKYVINNADQTPAMAIIRGTGHNDGEFFFYSKS